MTNQGAIGRVIATVQEPTTTGKVRFWLESDVRLKPFDFVRLSPPEHVDQDIGDFYAIITEIHQVSDEQNPLTGFISADFGQSRIKPSVSRIVTTYADATVLFNTCDHEMPVPHNALVHWPDEEGVRRALGIDNYRRRTPAGYITMSGPNQGTMTIPVDMDADYLMGPEGAHLNISGISGLATKTSYAMFLLTSIQQKQEEEWSEGIQASFIILNVKGVDLLKIDKEDPELDDATRSDWGKCGLKASPLKNVTYFYPYSADQTSGYAQTKLDAGTVEKNIADNRAYRYFYDFENARYRLGLLLEDMDDKNQTLASCIEHVNKIDKIQSWRSVRNKINEWAKQTPDPKIPLVSWRRFARLVRPRTKNPVFTEMVNEAKERKQVPLKEILNHLAPGHVVVVDIALLPDYLQSFIVGDIIDLVRQATTGNPELDEDFGEEEALTLETVILFADELNKFAPQHQAERSITRHLREVSERGRSEGIILFGAEQFRTGVEKNVTGNCSTQVFGRTTPVEVSRDPEIRDLPGNSRRVSFLRQGELVVSHTRFSGGAIKLRFPRNAYRTS